MPETPHPVVDRVLIAALGVVSVALVYSAGVVGAEPVRLVMEHGLQAVIQGPEEARAAISVGTASLGIAAASWALRGAYDLGRQEAH